MERREKARAEREWDRDKVREFGKPADEKEGGPRRSRSRERRRKERGKSKEKKGEKKGERLRHRSPVMAKSKVEFFQSGDAVLLFQLWFLQRNLKNLLQSCWTTCSARLRRLLVYTGSLSQRSR